MVVEVVTGGYTSSPLKYNAALDTQMKKNPMKSGMNGGWVKAARVEVDRYLNPNNYNTGDSRFQHLDLSKNPGVTAAQLNNYLRGKGVLAGQGAAFIQGGNAAGVNPIYLAVHANLETGGGTSRLARGTVSGYGGYHNVYGIGAYDGNALQGGASYARKEGWNSVSKAIVGGAKFVGNSYISKGQNTLYKMRWNPASPGNHQYATDIGWAVKQSGTIARVYNQYFSGTRVIVDLPTYDGQMVGGGAGDALGPKIIAEAKKHIGKPYVFGGNGPSSFDCSGFTKYVYEKAADMTLPRTADTQVAMGTPINIQDARAGDLIFWQNTYKQGVSHVAIAMGDGNFIGAQGSQVGIVAIDTPYWQSHYHSTRRVLSESDLGGGIGGGGGAGGSYVPVVNDETPTGLAGGLPLTEVNSYQQELEDALDSIISEGITHGIIVDLKNGGNVQFPLPDDISDSNPVSWEDVAILGRSVPVKGYENSGPRSLSFDLEFMAGTHIVSSQGDAVSRVQRDVAFLQSLTFPDYGSPFVLPPPVVLVSLGNIVKLKAVITNADVTWKKPYTTDGRPMRATVSVELQAVSDFPPDYYDVRRRSRNSIG